MKSDVWIFFWKLKIWVLKFVHWECGIENLGMRILNWKIGVWKILENFKNDFFFFFFFWVDWVNSAFGWVLSVGPKFWPLTSLSLSFFSFLFHLSSTSLPPLTLFIFFFTLIFLLHLTIYFHRTHFSKLLNLPSSISINISLDPCVFEYFHHIPIFGETHFSLHQDDFFLQGILFSYFSW